jgi:23S rRNA (adenine2503-C2)-methyltransferase
MKILAEYGREELAKVYVAQMREYQFSEKNRRNHLVEFAESIQPPLPREKKWVLIISSMFGCPIKCKMCDAGGDFSGNLTTEELLAQIEYMVRRRFLNGQPRTAKFKIQFARMGEPSLNPAVLEALEQLATRYDTGGLHISISSIAPKSPAVRRFFDELLLIKNRYYSQGRFQLQFSIHTTDEQKRNELIPTSKWSFEEIASYAERFSLSKQGDRKITLNFAPIIGYPIDVDAIVHHFNPQRFLIKLTPVNPTFRSVETSLVSAVDPYDPTTSDNLITSFKKRGYDVLLSIGELEENLIGSNCGQFIQRALGSYQRPKHSYQLERYVLYTSETKSCESSSP